MTSREHERIPYNVQVQFRTASSFLIAYSVNLSRGGIFLETSQMFPPGTELQLQFAVPGAGPMLVRGEVTWCRDSEDGEGPSGMGVEFRDVVDSFGTVIDRLVGDFSGVNILMVSADDQDRQMLSKMIGQIIGTSEVIGASDASVARKLLGDDIDLMVIDVDSDPEGALATITVAKSGTTKIPVIALTGAKDLQAQSRNAGADEVSTNPPPSTEFQRLLVRALGKPAHVLRES